MIVLVLSVLLFATRLNAETDNPSSYSLIGTIVSKAFIGAVINDTKGEQAFYRLYEKLPDGMQLVEVRGDSISLKGESGARYDIYINHDMKTAGAAASQSARIAPSAPSSPTPAISNPVPVKPNLSRGKRGRPSSPDND